LVAVDLAAQDVHRDGVRAGDVAGAESALIDEEDGLGNVRVRGLGCAQHEAALRSVEAGGVPDDAGAGSGRAQGGSKLGERGGEDFGVRALVGA
jgi:hypothetical protein